MTTARELRTEEGWPVATRYSGRPHLEVGAYVLEAGRQFEPNDRHIPDVVRVRVLERDEYRCQCCNWRPSNRVAGTNADYDEGRRLIARNVGVACVGPNSRTRA